MKPIIALAGRKHSGKSMVARYLETKGYHRASFAAPIKSMLRTLGVPFDALYGTDEQKNEIIPLFGKSGRHMMQSLGSEWGRDLVGQDTWVKLFFSEERQYPCALEDARFPNEIEAIRQHKGTVIGIRRPNSAAVTDHHISEVGAYDLDVDHWIANDGTPEELFAKVDTIIHA